MLRNIADEAVLHYLTRLLGVHVYDVILFNVSSQIQAGHIIPYNVLLWYVVFWEEHLCTYFGIVFVKHGAPSFPMRRVRNMMGFLL